MAARGSQHDFSKSSDVCPSCSARPQRAQDQTITLRRQGELITVEASPVPRPEMNNPVIAKFATGNAITFQGVRLRISKNLTPKEIRVP
jgi:hypothetical protein